MDDWIFLAKTKTALRRVVKLTHKIINSLKLELHPTKTYIGKISHDFNFLGYCFDDHKLLPSRESVKRLQERAVVLYEQPLNSRKYHRHKNADKDKRLRRYLDQWSRWLKCGLYAIDAFLISVKTHMPSLYALWSPGRLSSRPIA